MSDSQPRERSPAPPESQRDWQTVGAEGFDPSVQPGGLAAPAARPPRFSWPMRVFLAAFLADMVLRGLLSLTPAGGDWPKELDMESYPHSLPSQEELRQCEAGTHPQGLSCWQRYAVSLQSAGRFLVPWPTEKTRKKIDSAEDVGKYTLSWLKSRMTFCGRVLAIDQKWSMFSPNVGDDDTLARLRLVYADGSQREHRVICDPGDPTCYTQWFAAKFTRVASVLHSDRLTLRGYCRMLAHRFGKNATGSPLVRIEVFQVHYHYPSPDDDAPQWLAEQIGPPPDQIDPPFWEYDPRTQQGRKLRD